MKHSTRKLYILSVIVFNAILRVYLPIRHSIRTGKCFFRTCPPISDRRSWERGPFSLKIKRIKKKANLYSRFGRTQSKSYDRWRIVNLKKDHASTDRAKFFTPYFREKRPSFSASATLKTPLPKERRSRRIFCDPDTIAELYFLRRVKCACFLYLIPHTR